MENFLELTDEHVAIGDNTILVYLLPYISEFSYFRAATSLPFSIPSHRLILIFNCMKKFLSLLLFMNLARKIGKNWVFHQKLNYLVNVEDQIQQQLF